MRRAPARVLPYSVADIDPDEDDGTDTDRLASCSIFSCLGLSITGLPQVLDADVQGYFESDFFGPTGDEVNTF